MIDISINVTKVDGDKATYAVTPRVQVEFERHFKTGIAKAFGTEDIQMQYLYWLAWCASKYAGAAPKPFDSWLDEVAAVDIDDEGGAPLDGKA